MIISRYRAWIFALRSSLVAEAFYPVSRATARFHGSTADSFIARLAPHASLFAFWFGLSCICGFFRRSAMEQAAARRPWDIESSRWQIAAVYVPRPNIFLVSSSSAGPLLLSPPNPWTMRSTTLRLTDRIVVPRGDPMEKGRWRIVRFAESLG